MSGPRSVPRYSDTACGRRCARLCTDAGLATVLATDQGLLHWRAMRRLGDPGLAEHAVQETLLRAWRSCATYDPDKGSVRTWLLSIERNVLIDIGRMRAVRPAETSWDDVEEAADLRRSRPDFADDLADGLLVTELLARLPDSQRHAVVQVILCDRAYRDVAEDLGVPVGTVKTRVHYALRSLRQLPIGA
ncbi:sigma-70 family RNA polymerase sigma factor [Nocardia sp. BMG51109]|uniref:sigma-70 family RNA polymerase sigma factor n=1 Tax=Nocardia sp. BMG51109 TaxID=1056816 RepID=UPI000464C3FE|nr:sigma-70 family RNA polymerase sigma factor [Nocardia sp. BMG51109]